MSLTQEWVKQKKEAKKRMLFLKSSMVSDTLILPSCLIHFGLVIALWDREITTSVVIWMQKLLYKDCCRRCKTLKKFFCFSFNFSNTNYFFYLIDMASIKQELRHMKTARVALVEYFKKQKIERNQFINIE